MRETTTTEIATVKTSETTTSSQTPIEIALKIDENGMTTLSKLYEFLEINPSNYSRWCKKNIINNPFATENIDYISFRHHEENQCLGGRPKTDYKLTSDFAKQLCMTVRNERGKQARDYFIACEQGLKIATTKLKSQQYNNLEPLLDAITTLTQAVATMQQDISSIKESQKKKKLPEKKYSRWKTNTFSKLRILT